MSARGTRRSARHTDDVTPSEPHTPNTATPPLRRTRSQTGSAVRSSSRRRGVSDSSFETGETVESRSASPTATHKRNTPRPRKSRNATPTNEEQESESVDGGHAEFRTPVARRVTRSSSARGESNPSLAFGLSPNTGSPSLRDRTSAALDSVKQSCTRYQLLAFEHVPEWLRDNRYIRDGYRANIGWRQSVESVCHLHNETVNVWSHLIAFLVMTGLLIATMMVLSPHGADRLDLDVVLSSRPICDVPEGVERSPLCDSIIDINPNPTDSTGSEDPLELLHKILGEHQDEMLIELLSRVQIHVPNLQHLTQTLKEKASSIQDSLYAALPEDTSRQFKQLKDDTSLTFTEYVNQMDEKLLSLKKSLSTFLTPATSGVVGDTAAKAQARVSKEYAQLKDTLYEMSKIFSPDLFHYASPRNLDLIRLTEQVFEGFLDQTHFRGGFTLSPTLVGRPNVKVKVKSPVAAGMPLGSGTIFAQGLEDAMDDLSAQRSGQHHETELIKAHEHSSTTVDQDGAGKTTSTAIGYMTIEAHTSKSQPGLVQLQLHSYLPRYPLAIFIITAMMCLLFSSIYHLMHAVSFEWARRFQALDYAGIVLLTAGSTHPIIYYGFYCSPLLKWLYIGIVWSLALVVFFIVVLPAYRDARYRGLKVLCFVILGFSGCVPLCHFNYLLGEVHFILYWLLVMGFCYLSGAAIYLFQVPERWWPGHFDYFFSSHQLWHVSIFAAVLVHYFGLMHIFEWRMTRVCAPGMWS